MSKVYGELASIAVREFGDFVTDWRLFYRRAAVPVKLRLLVSDGTYVDVWLSYSGERYAYHWEQRAVRGVIHRHDNAPDHPEISTFPKHFHAGREENVQPSEISNDPREALRDFLLFVRQRLERDE